MKTQTFFINPRSYSIPLPYDFEKERAWVQEMKANLPTWASMDGVIDRPVAILKRARLPIGDWDELAHLDSDYEKGKFPLKDMPLDLAADRAVGMTSLHGMTELAKKLYGTEDLEEATKRMKAEAILGITYGYLNHAKKIGFELSEDEAREQATAAYDRICEAVEYYREHGDKKTYYSTPPRLR